MTDLSLMLVSAESPIRDAVLAIDRGVRQIALVVDDRSRLVASVTDGDVRRGLLRGLTLESPVNQIMRHKPAALPQGLDRQSALRLMQRLKVHHVPVVDELGVVVDLIWINDAVGLTPIDNEVIIMAGGLGTRLRPLTDHVPKPMLSIGERPLLEHIVGQFAEQGFRNFTLSINYRGDVVRDHFKDGNDLGVNIKYIEEHERLGTAGALSLLPSPPDAPVIVMNGDLLTNVSFSALLKFHADTGSVATMCAREYEFQVPYGVVEFSGVRFDKIVEKPTYKQFVNAGIYVLSPKALSLLERGVARDMPDLFDAFTASNLKASVFPVSEYWLDIGRIEDLERAREEFTGMSVR